MTVTATPPARREESVSGRVRTLAGLSLLAPALLLGREYGPQKQADLTTYDQRRLEISESLLRMYRLALDNPVEQRTVDSLIEDLQPDPGDRDDRQARGPSVEGPNLSA